MPFSNNNLSVALFDSFDYSRFLFIQLLFIFLFIQQKKCVFSGASNWFIGTEMLPNDQFPIIFESVKGDCQQSNFSWYNMDEVDCIEKFIKKLLSYQWNDREVDIKNIGVISPYKTQCEKVKEMCHRNTWDKLTVGSAEVFQGIYFFQHFLSRSVFT